MTDNRLIMTLFGATGDLASRKLYPAIYRLYKNKLISEHFALIGTGRTNWSHEDMRQVVKESIKDEVDNQDHLERFLSHLYYQQHDVKEKQHYEKLRALQMELDKKYDTEGNRIFYISLSPSLFPTITSHLKEEGLITKGGFNRLIIEKPFGHDAESAIELQEKLNESFTEDQIFRIDHYLGKEMVQAIRNIRFDNGLFDQKWNKDGIECIQISLTEEVGVEERGEYYDHSGATRDMVQNHALQLLALLTMAKPEKMVSELIQEQKIRILSSLVIPKTSQEVQDNFVRGQYGPSEQMAGYRDEDKVNPQSNTETYFAGKLEIDLPEWRGVPIFVRSGKRLDAKMTVIVVQFKATDPGLLGNQLIIEVAPKTGYRLLINQKELGYSHATRSIPLEFFYSEEELTKMPQDYERLIFESIIGDKSHFAHYLEVEHAWKFVDSILKYWENTPGPFPNYPAGSQGPKAAEELLTRYQTQWIHP